MALRSRSLLIAALLSASSLAGCGGSEREPGAERPASENGVQFDLEHWGEPAGRASLEPIDDSRTRVVVELTKAVPRARVDVHPSSCLELDANPLVTLDPVIDGRSETELALPIDELMSRESSLWVHVNAAEDDSIACGEFGSRPRIAASSPEDAAAIAACYQPVKGYGLEQGGCSRIEALTRIRKGVWRLQLRRPPVYCVEMHLNSYGGARPDVEGVGGLEEVRCPATAYPGEPHPDLRVVLRGTSKGRRQGVGVVSLTSGNGDRTRVLVEAYADVAWIRPGTCRGRAGAGRLPLENFYSFRSVTWLRVPLRQLTATPHAVEIDAGGAHGGVPIACAELGASR